MCAVVTVNPNALPLLLAAFTLTISIFFEGKLTSEALPIMKQERSVDEGPLHGSDFLSVFIDSSLPKKTFRTFTESSRKAFDMSTERRFPRSTLQVSSYTDATRRKSPTVGNFKINRNSKATSDNKNNDELVVAVRVSASVGRTLINKNEHRTSQEQGKNDIEENITQWTPTEKSKLIKAAPEYVPSNGETQTNPNHITDVVDQISIASEEHPSIIAESNKNEFNIEEKEPITTNSDMMNPHNSYVDNFQLSQRLPDFNPPPDLLERGQSQTKVHPYQQTVIFHNTGTDQARSVSYSTVAQGVSNLENKNWDGEKLRNHERQERHYDGSKSSDLINNFGTNEKEGYNRTDLQDSVTETSENLWDKTKIFSSTTPKFNERNWSRPSRPTYSPQPEQNYEVDESVSVVSNGRVHGVQPKESDSKNKKDDNQKVGYVVEGRNYRKYRVEERTSDGFIVGEYGVVSHDDGSLRGVRYTADGTINPRLIYDALMKFLSL